MTTVMNPEAKSFQAVKVTVNLPEYLVKVLKQMAAEKGITVTDALKRAIESERFLTEKENEGGKILIEGADRRIREIIRR